MFIRRRLGPIFLAIKTKEYARGERALRERSTHAATLHCTGVASPNPAQRGPYPRSPDLGGRSRPLTSAEGCLITPIPFTGFPLFAILAFP